MYHYLFFRVTFEHNTCYHLADQDLEGALKALEGQVTLEPDQIAIVKYTPSEHSPHGQYADEVYYPPVGTSERDEIRNIILPPDAVDGNHLPPLNDLSTTVPFLCSSVRHS